MDVLDALGTHSAEISAQGTPKLLRIVLEERVIELRPEAVIRKSLRRKVQVSGAARQRIARRHVGCVR